MAIFRGTGSASATTDQTTIDTVTQAVVDAEAAQTAAETAQGLAETAKTNAENLYGDLTAVDAAKTTAVTSATTATTKAAEAAASAVAAASDATEANESYILTNGAFLDFQTLFLGTKTVAGGDTIPPVLDNQGNALRDGALYFNGDSNFLFVYNEGDDEWINVTPSETVTLSQVSDVTANATEVNVLDVSAQTPTDGQVLTYDTTNGLNWETPATPTETNDLTASVTWANVPDANITQLSVTQHQAALSITESQIISDFGTYEPADATILKDADIGSTVQAYDAGLTYLDGLNFTDESTFKTAVNLVIGTDVEAVDTDILRADTADTITVPMRGTITDNTTSLTFDLTTTNNFKAAVSTGTPVLTFTGMASASGQSGNIYINNTGATISAATSTVINSADLTTISTAGKYWLSYYCDGTDVYVTSSTALTDQGL
jgi:hypothetical protein